MKNVEPPELSLGRAVDYQASESIAEVSESYHIIRNDWTPAPVYKGDHVPCSRCNNIS